MAYRSVRVVRTLAFSALGLALLQSLSAPVAYAAKQKFARSLSFDSGYIPQLASYHSMNNLWLEYEGLGSAIFDGIGDNLFLGKIFPTRALWVGAMYFLWPYADYGFFVANHELGHGARIIATGGTPHYAWNSGRETVSIFPFLIQGFTKYGQGAYTAGMSGSFYPTDWTTVVDAGGMNNSMLFAETLEDDVYFNVGHINQWRAYYTAKLDAYNYAKGTNSTTTGDVNNLINIWDSKGYGITTDDIKRGSLLSLVGNFTTLAYAWSILRYIAIGDPSVTSFSVGGLKLPDLSFFENRYGISMRARSALRTGNNYVPFSVEYIYKGAPQLEFSLGYRKTTAVVSGRKLASHFQAYASSKLGLGARIITDFQLGNSSFFTLGSSLFSVTSLEGERTIGHLITNTIGIDAWGKLSWVF